MLSVVAWCSCGSWSDKELLWALPSAAFGSLVPFLIYRQYPFRHVISIRNQVEAQERLGFNSLLNSKFPTLSDICNFGEPGEEYVPRAFSTMIRVKDKKWHKLCSTKYVALIKPLPRALNATAYSAEWNLKGFLVQLDCFSDVQPNFKYLLSIQNKLEIVCTQSYFYKVPTFCSKWKHHSNILVMVCLGFQFQAQTVWRKR